MLLRDLLVSLILIASLPVSFRRPWVGVLIYSWIGYMNPHKLTWGFAYSIPWAFLAMLATMGGMFFTRERKPLPVTRETVLLGLLWLVFFFSTFTSAIYPEEAWAQLEKVTKILFGTAITLLLMQDVKKLRLLVWLIALSIGFYGVKGGLFAVATGGQYQVLGPPGSFIAGNTEIGLAMNMVLPFLWLLRHDIRKRWVRISLLGASLLTSLAILVTYSRGALLGLGAVGLVLVTRSRSRVLALALLVVVATFATAFLPESWGERMGTIKTYEDDGSAMGRINAWRLAWRVALDRPVFGAGFQPFTEEIYARYLPEVRTSSTDAHNIFFQVLAEHGFTGLLVFIALIVAVLASLWRVQSRARRHPSLRSIGLYAQIVEASMVGYVVCGFFLSRSYFDLYYHLVAITILLVTLLRRAERALKPAPAPLPAIGEEAPLPLPEPSFGRV
ncbi:MAG TPA: putative O-glycosylation ligase, exosortase A system-associated [Candidatus Eisenbacteria bacterium]|nr:putative O-glycosylation ligase, exosortase A system-associated [Candidatus Eisenbacteria bacterium]